MPNLQVHNAQPIISSRKLKLCVEYLRMLSRMKAAYIFYFQYSFQEIRIINMYFIIHDSVNIYMCCKSTEIGELNLFSDITSTIAYYTYFHHIEVTVNYAINFYDIDFWKYILKMKM